MRIIQTLALAMLLAILLAAPMSAQTDKAGVVSMAASKFTAVDGLPACSTLSAQHGDPFKGPAVILLKVAKGCTVPWHWHTATESLMMVSGNGKLEMKDSAAAKVVPGDYVYLPGKHVHQFGCSTACTLFLAIDGAFDIHYVDKDGKEIPPAEALKSGAKKPAPAKAAPAEKKK